MAVMYGCDPEARWRFASGPNAGELQRKRSWIGFPPLAGGINSTPLGINAKVLRFVMSCSPVFFINFTNVVLFIKMFCHSGLIYTAKYSSEQR